MTAVTQTQGASPVAGTQPKPRERSLKQLAWWKFRRHRMAVFGVVLLALLLAYCTLGTVVFPYRSSIHNDLTVRLQAPSPAHPFGTDDVGRDLLARSIYGGQISLIIGISAAVVEVLLGVAVGTVAAYYGGWLDSLLMRFTEGMLSIPSLFLLLIMAKFFSGRIPNIDIFGRTFTGSVIVIIGVIGLTSWMYTARIVRANILSLKEQDFITAARCFGAQNTRIMTRHLLPNTMAPIIVAATLGVAAAILQEAYVSFLGLGVQAPTATWGTMLDSSYKHLEDAPWLWFFPGMLIVLTVLAINFVGDGLRDALDPRTRTE